MGKNLRIYLHLGCPGLYFSSLSADKEAESLDDLAIGGQVRELEDDFKSSQIPPIKLYTSLSSNASLPRDSFA